MKTIILLCVLAVFTVHIHASVVFKSSEGFDEETWNFYKYMRDMMNDRLYTCPMKHVIPFTATMMHDGVFHEWNGNMVAYDMTPGIFAASDDTVVTIGYSYDDNMQLDNLEYYMDMYCDHIGIVLEILININDMTHVTYQLPMSYFIKDHTPMYFGESCDASDKECNNRFTFKANIPYNFCTIPE